MHLHWIWLATRPELGEAQKLLVLEYFQDPENVYRATKDDLEGCSFLTPAGRESLLDKNLEEAEKILDKCMKKGISVCTFEDENYPYRLRNIFDPPLVLYYKGTMPKWEDVPAIGIVGTRKASAYGLTTAKQMGFQMVRCGAMVVSGVATGIDASAMEGALRAGGTVIGVLGNGADVVYPKASRGLYEDVCQRGCLLSEFLPGTKPYKWNFPKRNRIISGVCNGVLVVEAPEVSGSLITAGRALEQGRDVFAVPGNVGVDTSAGTNRLIREGAILARDGWDVVGEYALLYPDAVRPGGKTLAFYPQKREETVPKVAQTPCIPGENPASDKKIEKKLIDKEPNLPYSDVVGVASFSQEERELLQKIGRECLVDDLMVKSSLPAGKVLAMLTMLELRGAVVRLPGKRVKIKE